MDSSKIQAPVNELVKSRLKYSHFLLFLFITLPLGSFAQPTQWKFQHIGTDAGLSQSNITCILQDSRGFMWFGTRDGLNKYDGYRFTVFQNVEGDQKTISCNYITEIIEDKKGDLFIGTWGGGLNGFNREKNLFIHYPGDLAGLFVYSLFLDDNGDLWIATDGKGIYKVDTATGKYIQFRHNAKDSLSLGDNDVYTIFEDSRHRLWAGTSHSGLYLLDRQSNTFSRFRHNDEDGSSLSCDAVRKIFEDNQHRLWIGTLDGGADLMESPGKFRHFRHDPHNPNSLAYDQVISLCSDGSGNLWIGTDNGGISILEPDLFTFHNITQDDIDNTGLNNNSIQSLYPDRQGNVWVGTYSAGIDLYKKNDNSFPHYRHTSDPKSLSNNNVLDMLEDSQNRLWVGTDGGGLDLLDRKTGYFSHFRNKLSDKNSISGNFVLSLREDSHQNLWVGTWGDGLTVIDKQRKSFRSYKNHPADPTSLGGNNIYDIVKDKYDNMWIGAYGGGLDSYDPVKDRFIHHRHDPCNPNTPGSDRIRALLADNKGALWIATFDAGLDKLNISTGSFTHYRHDPEKNSISNNSINYLFEDSHGSIWICTAVGLNSLDPRTGRFKGWFTKDGLPGAVIFGIVEDGKGYLWISTNKGLSKFNPQTGAFQNFTVDDGIQSDEFKSHACFKSRSGLLYFGGVNGFNAFSPDSIKERPFNPPLVITRFQIFNADVPVAVDPKHYSPLSKDITETKEITLSYKSSVISFEFASLNYISPAKRQYLYMLEGFDKNWTYTSTKRDVTYTNLDPGHYVFRVRGMNGDGSWSPDITSINLTITPPFRATWWFRLLLFVSITGIIVSIHRLRLRNIESQKKLLGRQVEERTHQLALSIEEERKARKEAELANETKSEFMANMSHELRTPMNAIIGFTDLVLTTDLQKRQREYLENVKRSGYNLLGLINAILDYSKIEAGKLFIDNTLFHLRHLVEETVDMLAIKAFEKELDIICEIDPQLPDEMLGDPIRIQQILVNLIGNAVKFTEKGEIIVSVQRREVPPGEKNKRYQQVCISVKDTGIGIPEGKISRIFDSFTQVDSSTTRKYGGTGLGLTISRNLAEMMGGFLEVNSRLGEGSEFTLYLAPEVFPEQVPVKTAPGHSLQRILVVDGNISNGRLMKSIFDYMGMGCSISNSGAEALQTVLKAKNEGLLFDLIIADNRMPDMDGSTLVKEIKNILPGRPQPFILMLSPLEKNIVRQEAEQTGIDMFLSKPVKRDELEYFLSSIFEKNKTRERKEEERPGIRRLTENATILVAEDEPVNMLLISEVLGKMGFRVIKATNGKEALDMIAGHAPRIIFMDINMPEMDGYSATRAIRALDRPKSDIPIIALTADAMEKDKQRCLEAGMNGFISKPFRLEEIEQVLKRYIFQDPVQ